jgi:GT2 family glycosyltransferase
MSSPSPSELDHVTRLRNLEDEIVAKDCLLRSQAEQIRQIEDQLKAIAARPHADKDRIIEESAGQIQRLTEEYRAQAEKLTQLLRSLRHTEQQLNFKNKQLLEREQRERSKDVQLQEMDQQLRESQNLAREKDAQLAHLNNQLTDKERIIKGLSESAAAFGRSGSYRLGRALSWPLRVLKRGLDANNHAAMSQPAVISPVVQSSSAAQSKEKAEEDIGHNYRRWCELYDTLTPTDHERILARIEKLTYKPLISVVMPVFNVEEKWLRLAIESVSRQLYPNWELCIADDNSTQPHVRNVLDEYAGGDSRIKVVYRPTNGHISAATNSALELATGEFVALLDNDDELREHALYMVVETLNEHPKADLIYSDEDKLDENGERQTPHFKPDWNPDLFYSYNFVSHLGVFRRSILEKTGGFREGLEGSQDYDLTLRFIEQIPTANIRHIPRVLYHWRAVSGSTASASAQKAYPHDAAREALRTHFARTNIAATVTDGYRFYHRVIYPLPKPEPLVSLIVGTRDRVELLHQLVDGLLNQTDYESLEIIIVDNQSSEKATLSYFEEVGKDPRVRILPYDAPFNFSAINNMGVRAAKGEVVGLLNNDLKVISPGWLKEMVSHALRPEIGAVGARLLYANDKIQHAGVVLGVGGVAGHAYKHLSKDAQGYVDRMHVIQNFSAVTGACLVMRREVYEKAHGLDETNLPVAFNDVDFCIRIKELGYRILWTPYAELYHLESVSRGSDELPHNIRRFHSEVNYMRYVWKDVLYCDPCYNPNLTLEREDFSLAAPPRAPKPWKTMSTNRGY